MRRSACIATATTLAFLQAITPALAQDSIPSPQPAPPAAPAAPPPIEELPTQNVAPPPAETPTLDRFKQTLAPHGRWMETPEYGNVWLPNVPQRRWRPYTNGRWVYTERGWTFVSADAWGWAPFHYGRWVYYPPQGWAWIPGYEWAPAWVSWRYGGGYIGWAPLGPVGVLTSYYDTPSLWLAVRGPYFYRPLAMRYFVRTAYMPRVFRATYYAGVPRRGVYFSPPVNYMSRVVGRPIHRLSASRVAPYWAKRGVYRPAMRLRSAFRGAPVISRPGRSVRSLRGVRALRTRPVLRGKPPGGYRGGNRPRSRGPRPGRRR